MSRLSSSFKIIYTSAEKEKIDQVLGSLQEFLYIFFALPPINEYIFTVNIAMEYARQWVSMYTSNFFGDGIYNRRWMCFSSFLLYLFSWLGKVCLFGLILSKA